MFSHDFESNASDVTEEDLRLDGIVGLLREVNPSALERLKKEFPGREEWAALGRILGTRGDVAIKAALRATAEVVAWGEKATALAHDRLETARLLELIGQWVSFIGTFCTASAAIGKPHLVLPLAVIALLGHVCVASMHYYRGDLLGGRSKLISAYTTLVRSVPELKYIVAQLEEWNARGSSEFSDKSAIALANRAHTLAGTIHRAVKAVPGWRRILKPAQQGWSSP